MSDITLDKPVVIVPAQEALTANTFKILSVEENFGWNASHPDLPQGVGRPLSVTAVVLVGSQERRLIVWDNDDYLAVRGTWTDESLADRIKELLQS